MRPEPPSDSEGHAIIRHITKERDTVSTTNPEHEEITEQAVTPGGRLAAIEAHQSSMLGEMRQNNRRQDQKYHTLDGKIDNLYRTVIVIGGTLLVAIAGTFIAVLLD